MRRQEVVHSKKGDKDFLTKCNMRTQDDNIFTKKKETSKLMYACEIDFTDDTNGFTGCYSGTVNQYFVPH